MTKRHSPRFAQSAEPPPPRTRPNRKGHHEPGTDGSGNHEPVPHGGGAHRFARFEGVYVTLEENPIKMPYYLLRRTEPLDLRLDRSSRRGASRHLPPPLRALNRAVRFAIACTGSRLRGREPAQCITLPASGHVAVPMQDGGYRVIDLDANTVRTIFAPTMPQDVVRTAIERVQRIARHDFAPRVLESDPDERWLLEEYVEGGPYEANPSGTEAFDDVILPLVKRIARSEPPRLVPLGDYAASLRERIDRALPGVEAPLERARIARFASSCLEAALVMGEPLLPLVPTHGDLWRRNILITEERVVAVDWDAYGLRSAPFDAFFALLITHEVEMLVPLHDLRAQLSDAWTELRSDSDTEDRGAILPDLPEAPLRALFYLEFLELCLSDYAAAQSQAVRAHRLGRALRFIDVFRALEVDYGGTAPD